MGLSDKGEYYDLICNECGVRIHSIDKYLIDNNPYQETVAENYVCDCCKRPKKCDANCYCRDMGG